MINYTKITDIHQPVYRNIYINTDFDEFDDLTNDKTTRQYAHQLANVHYQVIDYIFSQDSWRLSRFGDGTFPVWYGSTNAITSFYETAYHWKRIFIQSPQGFSQHHTIRARKNLFSVNCRAALVDLRNEKDTKLTDKNPDNYPYTQQIGLKIFTLGQPGIINKSARHEDGECIALFNKKVLSSPQHVADYVYDYDNRSQKITVRKYKSDKIELIC